MTRIKFTSTALMNIFSGQNAAWYPSMSSGKLRWYDGTDWRWSTSAINNDQWHDIAFVFDNGTYSIYIDGVVEYSAGGTGTYVNGLISTVGRFTAPERYFNGSLDDIRMYNRALTAAEINIAFNGYPVAWAETGNITINPDNSITKMSGVPALWNASAVSQNILPAGEDGSMSFKFDGSTGLRMVGLSMLNNDAHWATLSYAFYFVDANILIVESANQKTTNNGLGVAAPGDELRISREGAQVKYYWKGSLVYTSTTPSSSSLRVDASIHTGSVAPISCTFDKGLVVKGNVQPPGLSDTDGSISLQLEGQYDPVTYTWSGGETTSSISGKARGIYSVNVTDAKGRTVTHSYELGYAAAWTNLTNVTLNTDNSLIKSNAAGWTSGASTLNVLPPNTDGWIEFVVAEPGSTYGVGFSRIDKDVLIGSVNYMWYIQFNGKANITEGGADRGTLAGIMKGDVYRIAREAGNINYYINGVVVRTITGIAAAALVADVSVYNNYGPLPVVTASFDKQVRAIPSFTFPDNNDAGGSVALSVQGTHAPMTVTWSSGETTNLITGKSRGIYTTTISDAASRTFTRSYRLGYPVQWNDLQNAVPNPDGTVSKSMVSTAWDAGGSSDNLLPPATDGWIEFSLIPTNYSMIGLARPNNIASYASIDYAFFLVNDVVLIYEAGVNRGEFASQAEGDIYTIAREGSNIKYYINGTVVRTVPTNTAYQLTADFSINAGTIPVISASFSRTPQTFYTITDGVWTDPNVWSLSEGGLPASVYPGPSDIVNIKGNNVVINTGIYSGDVNITVTNADTSLKIEGAAAQLNVIGEVTIRGQNNTSTVNALVVQSDGKISVDAE